MHYVELRDKYVHEAPVFSSITSVLWLFWTCEPCECILKILSIPAVTKTFQASWELIGQIVINKLNDWQTGAEMSIEPVSTSTNQGVPSADPLMSPSLTDAAINLPDFRHPPGNELIIFWPVKTSMKAAVIGDLSKLCVPVWLTWLTLDELRLEKRFRNKGKSASSGDRLRSRSLSLSFANTVDPRSPPLPSVSCSFFL